MIAGSYRWAAPEVCALLLQALVKEMGRAWPAQPAASTANTSLFASPWVVLAVVQHIRSATGCGSGRAATEAAVHAVANTSSAASTSAASSQPSPSEPAAAAAAAAAVVAPRANALCAALNALIFVKLRETSAVGVTGIRGAVAYNHLEAQALRPAAAVVDLAASAYVGQPKSVDLDEMLAVQRAQDALTRLQEL